MEITLTRNEEFAAHIAAVSLALKNTDYWTSRDGVFTANESGLDLHEFIAQDAQSIGSEWAVAKALGKEFDPSLDKGKRIADVGDDFEVKWTWRDNGKMIIQEWDRITDRAILVVGKSPHYCIKGWLPIKEARNPQYRHASQANWWIPQEALRTMASL